MKISGIRKILAHRFTFMLVPHGPGAPRQLNLHISTIFLLLLLWTGITCWGSYLSARHVDYWRTQVSNQVLKMKVKYLLAQVEQTRGFLDEVKQVDSELRNFLNYKTNDANKKAAVLTPATGGPSLDEEKDVSLLLQNTDPDLTWNRLVEKVSLMKQEAQNRLTSYQDLTGWIDLQKRVYAATPRGWPCPGRLTSHYGVRLSPFTGLEQYHFGVDISGPRGTPVRATADGIVRIAGWNSGYGNLVVIQHEFGYTTRYAHNSRLLVKPGERVRTGQTLALMGSTGKASGPHCHYEVWRNGQRKNPYAFIHGIFPEAEVVSRLPKSAEAKLKQS